MIQVADGLTTVKYVDVTIHRPEEALHPMQRYIRDTDAVEYEEMVAWSVRPARGVQLSLFHVEGDLERYERAVQDVETIERYHLSRLDDRLAYLWVVERLRPEFASFASAFLGRDLLALPPVRFDADAAMRMTLVGPGEEIQSTLEEVRDQATLTIHAVGPYDTRAREPIARLSDRQREAVLIAIEIGYYDVPRGAELAAVADRLDCAESTASVLLRRAEGTILQLALERSISDRVQPV